MATILKNNIILWGISASPYVRKVMVALAEKNIPYEQREILPAILLLAKGQPIPENFACASPLGKIPALQVGGFCIADSAVIAGYLDKKFSTGNKLYPIDPENYARALWFEHYSDNVLTEIAYKKIFMECVIKPNLLNVPGNMEIVEQAKVELVPLLDYLNHAVSQYTWIAGEEFSMADIAIATQLLGLKKSGFILEDKWLDLANYLTKVISRPSWQKIKLP